MPPCYRPPMRKWTAMTMKMAAGVERSETASTRTRSGRGGGFMSMPWPYSDSIIGDIVDADADADDATATPPTAPTIPSNQRWFTLHMSDTYQEHNYIYQDLLLSSSSSLSSSSRQDGGGGLHDPNLLAMFVTDHPHFVDVDAKTILL